MLIPELVSMVAAEVARLNGITLELAEDAVWAAGDVPELDAQGRRLVRLGGGREMVLLWPEEEDEKEEEEEEA